MKILVCDPKPELFSRLEEVLNDKFTLEHVENGKDAQKLLAKETFEVTIINIELTSYSSFEVIKFIHFKSVKTIIFLFIRSEKSLEEYGLNPQSLKRLGVFKVLTTPLSMSKIGDEVINVLGIKKWKGITPFTGSFTEETISAFDSQFTNIQAHEFFVGKVAIFDIFVRVKKNKYIKIFSRGEHTDPKRIENYMNKTKTNVLYFLAKERAEYINFMNEIIRIANWKDSVSSETRMRFIKNTALKLVEEVYAVGIDKNLINETLTLCREINKTISNAPQIMSLFEDLFSLEDSFEAHAYLSAIYSDLIAQNISWVTEHSRPKILMGALLQDLGQIKLPTELRNKKYEELSDSDFEVYKKHPEEGAILLERVPEISEHVKQIVRQHHELVNGQGFPNGFSGSKIYPLAKIVSFAGKMASLSLSKKKKPLDVFKALLRENRQALLEHDPVVIQAFIRSFIDKGLIEK